MACLPAAGGGGGHKWVGTKRIFGGGFGGLATEGEDGGSVKSGGVLGWVGACAGNLYTFFFIENVCFT